ncbi:MAG: hypothetical protein A3A80_02065 [Candidatus Terrybacteria bacterium RIFCSPLOWO2_01_FULL_44_24]|uniref:MgtC/SapB/SrpB/YhiD N-terminal domain-containing protein n=1 Tax=Candidatus Terrybacteria bacterium RIFCSPHIGHO2_01_FULL_43_35 TaxID=1802361 RepID=A0A1G2PE67_9BACT|nr:MAG: hypothetical protein A2828_01855 [Candidatus Terrybacteria bacterium RIFCSPHIGHO2_01_FULL_43_35]OHA50866.1 MAG: hypothetical protein A3A80_02065 [Candidatus Terrybacteria bacterium RIFCSPLOWO2_01_FULL_44_24]
MIDIFHNVPEVESVFRLLLAAGLGAIVGIEREIVGKSAGLRTFSFVSLGACLFTIVSLLGINHLVPLSETADPTFRYNYDPTRIVSQIVVGIGFLGAGLIVFRGFRVEGLTTSAGLWVVAAIGTAIGFGMYLIGVVTAVLVVLIFFFLKRVEPEHWVVHNKPPDHHESL